MMVDRIMSITSIREYFNAKDHLKIMNKLQNLIKKEKLAIISCYDATFASMLANTEVDALLVGDSLGTRVKGRKDILNVTMNEILYHTRAVKNGANSLPIIADMPTQSYDKKSSALINAKKIIEAGADGVKVEVSNFR